MRAQVKGRDIIILMREYLSTKDDTEKTGKEETIRASMDSLVKLDKDYGNALKAVFNKLLDRSDERRKNQNG